MDYRKEVDVFEQAAFNGCFAREVLGWLAPLCSARLSADATTRNAFQS